MEPLVTWVIVKNQRNWTDARIASCVDAAVAELPYGLGFRVQGLGLVKSSGLGLGSGLVQRLGSQGLGFKFLGFRV